MKEEDHRHCAGLAYVQKMMKLAKTLHGKHAEEL
jgi:hypothetical protein